MMKSITILLVLSAAASFAIPTSFILGESGQVQNHTQSLLKRSPVKRDVWLEGKCQNDEIRPLIARSMTDAVEILRNMIGYLDLLLGLYTDGDSGELRADKTTLESRSWDERIAFASYTKLISKINWSPGDERNRMGLQRVKITRDTAKAILFQYESYTQGTHTGRPSEDRPNVSLHCDEAEYLSEKNFAGKNYTEDGGKVMVEGVYHLSQRKSMGGNKPEEWVTRRDVCALQEGQDQKRFGNVPADPSISAYTFGGQDYLPDETITFCPLRSERWLKADSDRLKKDIHYRNLHVPIGSGLDERQERRVKELLKQAEFQGLHRRGIMWLNDFLVSTLIHESTHSRGFVGPKHAKLKDVPCEVQVTGKKVVPHPTTDIHCLKRLVNGEQKLSGEVSFEGHTDAQAFVWFAMATWANTVRWWSYSPIEKKKTLQS